MNLIAPLLIAIALWQPSAPTPAQIRSAAFDVMKAARYCTLVTIGDDGHPQARIVDPLIAETEGAIWIATNPSSRKVKEIENDPRVTLTFFNGGASEYVTLVGSATVVTDADRKAAHWKAEWQPFYKQQSRGPDFMLFEVKPSRLEVSSARHRLVNDPGTWLPVILDLQPNSVAGAQVPPDLRAAMQARDAAFYAADAVQWEKYTAPAFTTVQQDGSFMTRAERLANLRTQTARSYVPRSRELNERRGDTVIARFFSGGLWVVEVWTRETGAWTVLMSQVTTAKPE
jgi:general stress protein 26